MKAGTNIYDIDIKYTSKKDEERIGRLFRRAEHLETRIKSREFVGDDANLDSAELSAIKHVLTELGKARNPMTKTGKHECCFHTYTFSVGELAFSNRECLERLKSIKFPKKKCCICGAEKP